MSAEHVEAPRRLARAKIGRHDRRVSSYVLVHSPAVGPGTWGPVAELLRRRGHRSVVPDLSHVGSAAAPFWPYVAGVVSAAMLQWDEPDHVVLVAHSNAGLLLPTIAETSSRVVTGAVLVDAAVPQRLASPAAASDFRDRLADLAGPDGLLPPWTDWWPAADIQALLPDPEQRAQVVAEQPRLPLRYYAQEFPTPDTWWSVPRAYLRLSPAYDAELEQSREEGLATVELDGGHLHQVIDPGAVADAIEELTQSLAD